MARNTKIFQITDAGRDQGKTFVLTEMPAMQAERWALRAMQALLRSNVDLPDNIADTGMAGIAKLGLKALGHVDEETFFALMDEMMGCVAYMPDPMKPNIVRPATFDGDIEEVTTRLQLRAEVFQLHVGFLMAGAPSTATASSAVTAPA